MFDNMAGGKFNFSKMYRSYSDLHFGTISCETITLAVPCVCTVQFCLIELYDHRLWVMSFTRLVLRRQFYCCCEDPMVTCSDKASYLEQVIKSTKE